MRENRIVGYWLLACASIVYLMIVVGGMTRLTQSGLSMVEWDPIMGIIPPLTDAAWSRVFELYRLTPEYLKVNAGMSLFEFKSIFWWEYGHRVLGRIIGMFYLIPLLFFFIKGWIPRRWWGRLGLLFTLGGLQGFMGWYMVQSGLIDVPRVSQYRLTAHLGLAVIIFTCMLWFALDFLRGERAHSKATQGYIALTALSVFIVFLMMLSGGFVAGTRAGFIMNTFPMMNGEWVPTGVMAMQPWWKNLFENAVTVQFVHRCLAVFVVVTLLATYWVSLSQRFITTAWSIVVVLCLQVTLGVAALLNTVPLVLGAGHQAGAVALLATTIYVAHRARKSFS